MKRVYDDIIQYHLKEYSQMIFLGGPRQVGKTTLAKDVLAHVKGIYLNWDVLHHRDMLLNKLSETIVENFPQTLGLPQGIIILDEIHKYRDWKNYLKGIYDTEHEKVKIIVTGSARLDLYKRGGDSLMGRYFPYTIHPFSVREIISPSLDLQNPSLIQEPQEISEDIFEALWTFGGFPEPLIRQNKRFHTMWKLTRFQQLFREDIRDVNSIRDLSQLELLATLLEQQVGKLLNYVSLATHARVSDNTVRRWLEILENFYFCFKVSPWTSNISRSLIKDPKIYLWDWSSIEDKGARFENFIASHLLKAAFLWKEIGLGDFKLHFCRTKDKKEVDFLVTKDQKPWILVEANYANSHRLSPTLGYFQEQLKAPYALQVVLDMPYVPKSCFESNAPLIVPARTFLSQLV